MALCNNYIAVKQFSLSIFFNLVLHFLNLRNTIYLVQQQWNIWGDDVPKVSFSQLQLEEDMLMAEEDTGVTEKIMTANMTCVQAV